MPIGICDIEIRQLNNIKARFVKHQSVGFYNNPCGLKVHFYNYFEHLAIYRLGYYVEIYCLPLVALRYIELVLVLESLHQGLSSFLKFEVESHHA